MVCHDKPNQPWRHVFTKVKVCTLRRYMYIAHAQKQNDVFCSKQNIVLIQNETLFSLEDKHSSYPKAIHWSYSTVIRRYD